MSPDHRDVVRRSFEGQATAFEDPTRSFGQLEVMAWMREQTPTTAGDIVLEVAAGTALFSRAIAERVGVVVAVDLTPAILTEGKRATHDAGITNIVFQVGDATQLPFLDDSFDRVLSRLAIHHFEDASVPLREMARVCRPGGTVTVIDMVVIESDHAATFNELEHRRDPAHTRALSRSELHAALEATGLTVTHTSTWENVLDGERWLEQTNTPDAEAARIRAAWDAELDGGAPTGMHPRRTGDRIEFVHHWDLLVATAPTP